MKKFFTILLSIIVVFNCFAVLPQAIDSDVTTMYEVTRNEDTIGLHTLFVEIGNFLKTIVHRNDLGVVDINVTASEKQLEVSDNLNKYINVEFSPAEAFNTEYTIEWYTYIKETNRAKTTEVQLYSQQKQLPSKEGKYLMVIVSEDGGYRAYTNIYVVKADNCIYYRTEGSTVYITNTLQDGYTPSSQLSKDLGSTRAKITDIIIEKPITLKSYESFFEDMTQLKNIKNIKNLRTDLATNLDCMFFNCQSLESIDVSNFNLSRATDIGGIFAECKNLKYVDVSNWNTSKVEIAGNAFCDCMALETLDVSKWDTHNIWTTYSMFAYCTNLKELDVSNWDMRKNQELAQTFCHCSSLTKLDISKWQTPDLKYIFNAFSGLSNVSELDVSGLDTTQVDDFNFVFSGLGLTSSAKEVVINGLSNWNTENVTNMNSMFSSGESHTRTGKLTNKSLAGISKWDTSKVTDMTCMFYGQGVNLTQLDISAWDVTNCTSFNHMFCDCKSLISLDLSKWNVENLKTVNNMFDDCYSLTTVGDISHWNTKNLIDCASMFDHCSEFHKNGTINLSHWNTENLITCGEMFRFGTSKIIDLSNWSTKSLSNNGWTGDKAHPVRYENVNGIKYPIYDSIYYETGNITSGGKRNDASAGMLYMFRDNSNLELVITGNDWKYTGNFWTTNMWANPSTDLTGMSVKKNTTACKHIFENHKCTICNKEEPGLYDNNNKFIMNWEDSGLIIDQDYSSQWTCTVTSNGDIRNGQYITNDEPNNFLTTNGSGYKQLKNHPEITKIVIPDYIFRIGDYAFANCSNLKQIILNDMILDIGDGAFIECSKLTSLNITKSIRRIGDSIFVNCPEMQNITVDSDNTDFCINNRALCNAKGTELIYLPASISGTYVIPEEIITIKENAFNQSAIEYINFPETVTTIEDYGFSYCSNLKEITFPAKLTSLGDSAFQMCPSLEKVVLNANLNKISSFAFFGNKALSNIYIPLSVKNIDYYAFNGAPLKTINYQGALSDWNSININTNSYSNQTLLKAAVNYIN